MRAWTVSDRLVAAQARDFVGRHAERATLAEALRPGDGPAAVAVHGPAGIGKTALVQATVAEVDGPVRWIEAADVEPTPAAFRLVLGEPPTDGVVVIDGTEHLHVLDGWIRNDLLPSFPAGTTTVLVGRDPPNLAWRTSLAWRSLLHELAVGPLDDADARALLHGRGVSAEAVERIVRFGRGHPLALVLAAAAAARHPELDVDGGAPPEVVETLVDVLVADLSPEDRALVEAAAIVRRPTPDVLAALTDTTDPAGTWRRLRDLSLTRMGPDGLRLDGVVQDVIAASLELRDPERVQSLRRRAATVLVGAVGPTPTWGATADLLHLVRHPAVRRAFFPPGGIEHPVERAMPGDVEDVVEMTELHDGPAGAAIVRRWLDARPTDVVVSRGSDGRAQAYSIVVERADLDAALVAPDPVLDAWRSDLDVRTVAPDDRVLFNRRAVARASDDRPSPALGPMWIDIKRTYLELRPRLRRVYAVVRDFDALAAAMVPLGFVPLGRPVAVGALEFQPVVLDFGPGSIDAWLGRLVQAELSASDPRSVTEDGVRPAGAPGRDAGATAAVGRLSAREREVLAALAGGLSNRELAGLLFISERTANRHVSNIFTKLGVRNRTAAARVALAAGLVR